MGHKVNPLIMRANSLSDGRSVWYAEGDLYVINLMEDYSLRKLLAKKLHYAYVEKIIIKRNKSDINVVIFTSRPGLVIGQKGQDIEKLKKIIFSHIGKVVEIDVVEVKNSYCSASLIAQSISYQLEKRFSFRRAMKKAINNTINTFGIKGVKIRCAGRLGGVDIARAEWYVEGSVPLHRLKADIDYSATEANTSYGKIGIKVWLYKGDVDSSIKNK
ncbi:30S ribosomal protein S3 [Anaplasmataceae bacterium AB001_6]|nr:30S ribosomal protein S3 [Anaplasmataceae bacterium AB001_6]